ncbi:hypothetical protein M885DRAFT_612304 [Pelagophyceae sp. CCMP2097]|nr:hypothetical protein M885DRAFT_612304 [Pelagophyceae sp. CCMP2097]
MADVGELKEEEQAAPPSGARGTAPGSAPDTPEPRPVKSLDYEEYAQTGGAATSQQPAGGAAGDELKEEEEEEASEPAAPPAAPQGEPGDKVVFFEGRSLGLTIAPIGGQIVVRKFKDGFDFGGELEIGDVLIRVERRTVLESCGGDRVDNSTFPLLVKVLVDSERPLKLTFLSADDVAARELAAAPPPAPVATEAQQGAASPQAGSSKKAASSSKKASRTAAPPAARPPAGAGAPNTAPARPEPAAPAPRRVGCLGRCFVSLRERLFTDKGGWDLAAQLDDRPIEAEEIVEVEGVHGDAWATASTAPSDTSTKRFEMGRNKPAKITVA